MTFPSDESKTAFSIKHQDPNLTEIQNENGVKDIIADAKGDNLFETTHSTQQASHGKHVGGKGKTGPTSERDSVNALLSLGRDLHSEESSSGPSHVNEDTSVSIDASSTQAQRCIVEKRAPQPILPSELVARPKKRNKKRKVEDIKNMPDRSPPDFWFWISEADLGEWDVLCGRGGESNNFIGNRKYRKLVDERKSAYREIPLKQRKAKTAFVRSIVEKVKENGGRFIDQDISSGRYYVVTMEKARKKTSQALRETKELKWLELQATKDDKNDNRTKNSIICRHCNQPGHKTKIAKACLKHHEWVESNEAVDISVDKNASHLVSASPGANNKNECSNHGTAHSLDGMLIASEKAVNADAQFVNLPERVSVDDSKQSIKQEDDKVFAI